MFCPNRECPNVESTGEPAEYREGIQTCADCGATLVEAQPTWTEESVDFEAFVPVVTLYDMATLLFAKSLLEGAGIRYYVQNEQVQDLFGLGRLGTGFSTISGAPVVLVEPSRAEEGSELMATLNVDPEFSDLRRRINVHERADGYYLIDLVSIAALRDEGRSQEEILDWVLEYFDDQPWPPPDERLASSSWEEHAASRSRAEEEAVAALVGGMFVGHSRDTVSPDEARELWKEFESFFPEEPQYYVELGLGDRDNVYSRGVVILDRERAGILWVVESD